MGSAASVHPGVETGCTEASPKRAAANIALSEMSLGFAHLPAFPKSRIVSKL
jgi:hypothetical protein